MNKWLTAAQWLIVSLVLFGLMIMMVVVLLFIF